MGHFLAAYMVVIFQTDGGQWSVIPKVTATCVGNAKYFGGGMHITPTADPFDGRLEVKAFDEEGEMCY